MGVEGKEFTGKLLLLIGVPAVLKTEDNASLGWKIDDADNAENGETGMG